MKCYLCNQKPGPGGTYFHVNEAVGICHECGVAVCAEHSESNGTGIPLAMSKLR